METLTFLKQNSNLVRRAGIWLILFSLFGAWHGMSHLPKLFRGEEISRRGISSGKSVKWSNRQHKPSVLVSAKGIRRKEGGFDPRAQGKMDYQKEAGMTRAAKQGYIQLCCYGDRNDLWRVCESLTYDQDTDFLHCNWLERKGVHDLSVVDICCIFL